uniref:G_PROTEIN_RECEP_F1_2 domain-containing protein n=1 Tax=Steinernema glaseri TaxID=37863 RepID=A0A1I7ZN74_9BILA
MTGYFPVNPEGQKTVTVKAIHIIHKCIYLGFFLMQDVDFPVSQPRDEQLTMDADEWWQEHCSIIPPEPLRLLLVAVVGSALALLSIAFNLFLFVILIKNSHHRASHLVYLTFLALIDVFLSASYILMFPVNLFMDYFESTLLAAAWWAYMRPMLAFCHVAISASALLITAAAMERYLTISRIRSQLHKSHRVALSLVAVGFALVSKAPMFFEMQVVENGNCTGVTGYRPDIQEWTNTEPYKTVYRFWFRNIITIFLPFFMCLYFNVAIVLRLRQQHIGARLFRFATSEHRKNIRSATRMLVLVTCTYIGSNVLNVVVSVWEFIDMESLYTPEIRPFYTYSSDLVSVLTVLSSTCRLPIYCSCNARIRREVVAHLDCLSNFSRKWKKKNEALPKITRDNIQTLRYCNTGNGLMIFHPHHQSSPVGPKQSTCVGTGIDKIVLSVALSRDLKQPLNGEASVVRRLTSNDERSTLKEPPAQSRRPPSSHTF